MTQLFAAIDAVGDMRFVGEVARGADCACVCPECGSPLVARQGSANDWHFAHEAQAERPGCRSGVLTMLRRLAAEHLQAQAERDGWSLPPYQQRVAIVRALINVHEDVHWGAQIMGPVQWNTGASSHEPVARARLDTGVAWQLFVAADGEEPPAPATDGAQMVFRCRLPPAHLLRERATATQHLKQQGELAWCHHPDTRGLVAQAQARLEARSRQIYRNWLAMADAAGGPARVDDAEESRPAPLFYAPATPVAAEAAPRFACAPGHAPHVSFTFYRLSDNEAWLLYLLDREGPADWRTASEKFYALAPHPGPFAGWAEALPVTVGVPDRAAGVVRCKGFLQAVTYLSRRSQTTRSARDPSAFEGL